MCGLLSVFIYFTIIKCLVMIQQIVKANQVTILYISSGHSLCVLVSDKFCEVDYLL